MENYIRKIIFANSVFQFDTVHCDCEVDVTHPSKGIKKHTFQLYPKESKCHFAYVAGQGLVIQKQGSRNDGRAVMPDLLAIKEGDVKAVKAFIERNGFFFWLAPGKENAFKSELLFGLILRLRTTVLLMSALGEKEIDYEKILALTMYLLFSPQIRVDFSGTDEPFLTCNHELGHVMNNISLINERGMQEEESLNAVFFVNDTIRPPRTIMDAGEYLTAIDFDQYNFTTVMDKFTYLFVNAINVSPQCRNAIDFFYHFCKDVGVIKTYDYDGKLTFLEDKPTISDRFIKRFDLQLQTALLWLAKYTLKTEIEWNLCGIVPTYDIDSMAPSWHVVDLLSGLYFSVFYMQPDSEIYRACANPNCGLHFLVKTTSSKKIYCQPACANAMAQRRHRFKQK